MSEVLHKSAIITGCVNAFCLVCDSFFQSKEEAHSHVNTSSHAKNLCLFPYIDKFQDQNIRKVKAGYFCEYCNELLLTAMKVDLHIAGEAHKQNRGTMLVKPSEHGIIAFNNVHIQERAWHGLKDGVCSLCDTEVEDESLHKRDVSHILNLVQMPIKFGTNDAVYRLTDDSTMQCLTCNEILSVNGISKHFVDDHHLDHYTKCKIEVNNGVDNIDEIKKNIDPVKILTDLPDNSNVKEENPKISNEHNISNILSCVSIYRNNDIDVNFETDTAFCRKCCVDIKFDCNDIEKHIAAHLKIRRAQSAARYPTHIDKNTFCLKPKAHKMFNAASSNHNDDSKVNALDEANEDPPLESSNNVQNGEKSDSDDDRASTDSSSTAKIGKTELEINNNKCNFADVKVFAKENHITYNQQNSNAFCRICQVKLPSSLRSMKEHVQGASHTKKVPPPSTQTKTKHLKKRTMELFLHSIHSSDFYPEDFVINKRFCIKKLSFLLLINNSRGMRCLLCEENIYYRPPFGLLVLRAHVASPGHRLKMDAVPVITSEPSEFIREIRPDSFHCGFCNLVLSGWSEMENHLKCTDHIDNKLSQERITWAERIFNQADQFY